MVAREDDRLRARPHSQLVEDIRGVITDRFLADGETVRDIGIAQSLRNQPEDLPLAARQRGKYGRVGRLVQPEKFDDRVAEPRPRRLVLQQHVIARVELDELRARNAGGQPVSFINPRNLVTACVQDERRRTYVAENARDVNVATGLE